MQRTFPLHAVTLDGSPFALIRACDAVEAVDLAWNLYAARWIAFPAVRLSAAEHRPRFTARLVSQEQQVSP